ncbi:plant UBX domain-containing protein 10-like [Prosopis cineraria]|uniref:plant UBX domain-containing protein 10-like n=1 Tax=Prosopis cineraria TaxID=364024 RepID=UPI002410346C|nr:plant UBX domain-containing protein 10-like [Prosopis cineraria]
MLHFQDSNSRLVLLVKSLDTTPLLHWLDQEFCDSNLIISFNIFHFLNPRKFRSFLRRRLIEGLKPAKRKFAETNPYRMSSATRDHGIFSRMASLPRSIMGEFSRAMSDIGSVRRRRRRGSRSQNELAPSSSDFQFQPLDAPVVRENQWAFLESFEHQYGTVHPFFYACRLMEVLKLAEQDKKLVFMYIHSPEHPFTHNFCRETLCCELVTEFLDVNFACWGGLADRGEGLRMVATLRPASFPLCAVVAPAAGDTMAVLQQIEGPVSAAELVEVLQRTMEEQGLAFGSDKARREEKIRADRRLREEQDAAYFAALQIDKEKENLRNSTSGERVQKPVEALNTRNHENLKNKPVSSNNSKVNESTITTKHQNKGVPKRGGHSQPIQILIRFPNGERREQSFECTDKVQSIFAYIDSLGLPGIGNYRLVSNFPRRMYGVDEMRMTLKDAGFHPKASLFLEPISADP